MKLNIFMIKLITPFFFLHSFSYFGSIICSRKIMHGLSILNKLKEAKTL